MSHDTVRATSAATPFPIRFNRGELRERLSPSEGNVLDNFLTKMNGLGVIRPDPEGGRGAYRFVNQLHYVYFWREGQRARGRRRRLIKIGRRYGPTRGAATMAARQLETSVREATPASGLSRVCEIVRK